MEIPWQLNPWAKARRLDRVIDHYAHDFAEQHLAYQAVCARLVEAERRVGDLVASLAEADQVITGLRADLNRAGGHDQYACLERDQDVMKAQLAGVRAGTVLRFTDTGGSVVLDQDGHWVPR